MAWQPHALHAGDRIWPETNCYVDLWIEILHAQGCEPRAGLPFTVAQDFEGDQFTFFKVPAEDLRLLFGLEVQELALYDGLEAHARVQLARGCMVLAEVDAFHLPDTRGTAYRTGHVKTTIGIAGLEPEARRLEYFHNAGRFTLEGEDYDGVFRRTPALRDNPDLLPPYVEFVRRDRPALAGGALLAASLDRLRHHLGRRPDGNPVTAYRAVFPDHAAALRTGGMERFHLYAFNTLRQLGANAELLGAWMRWLDGQGERGLLDAAAACDTLAGTAKALQFQLARAVNRRAAVEADGPFAVMERAYDTALATLVRRYG